jgi:hypothetical protein
VPAMRMVRVPNQSVMIDGVEHFHTIVRAEQSGDENLEVFSFDSRRPISCEKCLDLTAAAMLEWRSHFTEKYGLPENFWN